MRIAVCGSMTFSPEMLSLGVKLKELGHEVVLPEFTEEYARLNSRDEMHSESAHNKVEHDLIRGYFETIKEVDAVLIYNPSKRGIENYVGGNTFLEMGFAHILEKPIFMWNPIPDLGYRDEMEAMRPRIINGDLSRLVYNFVVTI
ncbi:MAG: hypothetical protein AABW79_01470 [Nanoarchaeota archaeon]